MSLFGNRLDYLEQSKGETQDTYHKVVNEHSTQIQDLIC